jgi:hypothetical protein
LKPEVEKLELRAVVSLHHGPSVLESRKKGREKRKRLGVATDNIFTLSVEEI